MITLYSKPNCPYCVSAKKWLNDRNVDFTEINIMENAESLAFLKEAGHKSVPQLYLDGKLLEGGFEGLRTMGYAKLKTLLES